MTKFRRILLKLSGEALVENGASGINATSCQEIARSVKAFVSENIELAIVIGGGNIFRGMDRGKLAIERIPADQMGMLATMINGMALQAALEKEGLEVVIMSAFNCGTIFEPFQAARAKELLSQKKVLIFVGGTGHPFFTTDTAAALRAAEIEADALFKATKVDGVYSKDPMKHKDAKRYDKLTFTEVLAQKLNVMDATSVALCMMNNIPIVVFNMQTKKLSQLLEKGSALTKVATLVH